MRGGGLSIEKALGAIGIGESRCSEGRRETGLDAVREPHRVTAAATCTVGVRCVSGGGATVVGAFIQCASRGARRACAARRAYTRYSRCASPPIPAFPHTYAPRTRTPLHLRIWTLYSARSLSRRCPRTNGAPTRRALRARTGVCGRTHTHAHRSSPSSRTEANAVRKRKNVRERGRCAYVGPTGREGTVRTAESD